LQKCKLSRKLRLDDKDFKSAGFLLAKMLPLGAGVGIRTAEPLTRRLMESEDLSIDARCGFIIECDNWTEKGAWASLDKAYDSLERAGVETPRTLAVVFIMAKLLPAVH
jgi:hypothetical protein